MLRVDLNGSADWAALNFVEAKPRVTWSAFALLQRCPTLVVTFDGPPDRHLRLTAV
jgi:hypothetical protein